MLSRATNVMISLLGARQYGMLRQAQAAAIGSLRVLHDRLFNSSSTPTPAPPVDTEEPKQHYEPGGMHPVDVVHKLGPSILHDPWWVTATPACRSADELIYQHAFASSLKTNCQGTTHKSTAADEMPDISTLGCIACPCTSRTYASVFAAAMVHR